MGGVHEPGKRLLDTLPQVPHRGLVQAACCKDLITARRGQGAKPWATLPLQFPDDVV